MAPADRASDANRTPCPDCPGTAANTSPARTCLLCAVIPVTETSGPSSRPCASSANATSRWGTTCAGRGKAEAAAATGTSAQGSAVQHAVLLAAHQQWHVPRQRTGRRDVRVLQLVGGYLLVQRRRNVAAVESVRRVIDHDRDHELWVVGGSDASERIPQHRGAIRTASGGIGLLGGAGLAGDAVTRDRCPHSGPAQLGDRLEHGSDDLCSQ